MKKFEVKAGAVPEIYIYDDIGPDWAGMISGETVAKALAEIGNVPKITVRINSPGGDCFEAFAIYNALRRHGAKITVEIDALAASAASLVAMSGDRICISENALLMVHNCWTIVTGNRAELARTIEVLGRIDENLRATYAAKTGLSMKEITRLMDAETWFTASEAVDAGFCDGVVKNRLTASAKISEGRYRNTPARLIGGNSYASEARRKCDESLARITPKSVAKARATNEAARTRLGI